MAYTNTNKTWVPGETVTGSILNTYVRDQFDSQCIAKSTAVGDTFYASASTGLISRLAIGTTGKVNVSIGGVPGWAYLSTVDAVAAGVYALGQKQGAGANALRVEYIVAAIAEADGVDHNQTLSFAAGTVILAVAYSIQVDTGAGPWGRVRSIPGSDVVVAYNSAVAGNHHVVAIVY